MHYAPCSRNLNNQDATQKTQQKKELFYKSSICLFL
uniref:Uncharacterized protein n=1 Tax=Arundo donax TaxID=35708 RepID=A0A0A9FA68_ARUDO